jgi:hypothetical protein
MWLSASDVQLDRMLDILGAREHVQCALPAELPPDDRPFSDLAGAQLLLGFLLGVKS